jgi:hypothetical protein
MRKILAFMVLVVLAMFCYADSSWLPGTGLPPDNGVAGDPDGNNQDVDDGNDDDQDEIIGLEISYVKVSPSRPEPGEEVEVEIRIENIADEDIENIDFALDMDGLEDIDGEDIEEDDNFDIRKGSDKELDFKYTMPYDVDDGDKYVVNIIVEGTGEDTGITYSDSNSDKKIEFDKRSHQLMIENVRLRPSMLSCDDRVELEYSIINIGRNDEEAEIMIFSSELGIDYRQDVEIDEDDDLTESITVNPELIEGSYDIEFRIEYGSRDEEEILELDIRECRDREASRDYDRAEKNIVKGVEETRDSIDDTSKDVIVDTFNYHSFQGKDEGNEPISAKLVKRNDFTFRESEEYYLILIVLFILLLGAVIFAFGAVIILAKK